MPQLITYGNELIRINPSNNKIEYSTNRGSSWITRYSGSGCGQFRDLLEYGNEIIACTDQAGITPPTKALHGFAVVPAVWQRRSLPFRMAAANSSAAPMTATSTIPPTKARRGLGADNTEYQLPPTRRPAA